jgi:hypothetical protein
MQVMALDPALERLLGQALQGGSDAGGIEPGLADTLLRETSNAARQQEVLGLPAVLLVPSQLRWLLSRFLRRAVPDLKVIANGEVPDSKNHQGDVHHRSQKMTVRRFVGATARDCLRRAKETLGADAVVVSNRAVEGGVEIVAMSPESLNAISQGARPGSRAHHAPKASMPVDTPYDTDYTVSSPQRGAKRRARRRRRWSGRGSPSAWSRRRAASTGAQASASANPHRPRPRHARAGPRRSDRFHRPSPTG